jgi:hypothetical protein
VPTRADVAYLLIFEASSDGRLFNVRRLPTLPPSSSLRETPLASACSLSPRSISLKTVSVVPHRTRLKSMVLISRLFSSPAVSLSFLTHFVRAFLSIQSMEHLSRLLKSNFKDLIDVFPPSKKTRAALEAHFKAEGLPQIAEWYAKRQTAIVKDEMGTYMTQACEEEEEFNEEWKEKVRRCLAVVEDLWCPSGRIELTVNRFPFAYSFRRLASSLCSRRRTASRPLTSSPFPGPRSCPPSTGPAARISSPRSRPSFPSLLRSSRSRWTR